ncbi:CgeB family protein [Azospirillum sp.]|uniref:CgeB family protein n=1 Tax=Azospirillum sp. TaxID=34012 RepID=UPI002D5F3508|nr:glycosyltransferase [Azospirillum sp.]HYD70503.1 glycosyltransferase [Azospirillum sp.]
MRFLVVDTIYEGFLHWLYQQREPGLAGKSFQEQYETQEKAFFHSASAWAAPLRALGHEVLDVSANNAAMQVRWMVENGLADELRRCADTFQFGGFQVRQQVALGNWQRAIVAAQVRAFRPDVLLCANLYMFEDSFLDSVKGFYGKAVGQHAAPMPKTSLSRYDLIISAGPAQIQEFRARGLRCEKVALAFDERLLPHLEERGKRYEVGFTGQLSAAHSERVRLIVELARAVPIDLWGEVAWPEGFDAASLKLTVRPPVWGLDMYQALKDCRMALNKHIDVAGPYAVNLRMYEVTGVGSLLVTDNKSDIREYFQPDEEIVVYDDVRDGVAKIRDLMSRPEDVARLAAAGQRATLTRHSYRHRVQDLLALAA